MVSEPESVVSRNSFNSGFTGSGRCAPSGPTWDLSCLVLAHESRQAPSSVKRTRYLCLPSCGLLSVMYEADQPDDGSGESIHTGQDPDGRTERERNTNDRPEN